MHSCPHLLAVSEKRAAAERRSANTDCYVGQAPEKLPIVHKSVPADLNDWEDKLKFLWEKCNAALWQGKYEPVLPDAESARPRDLLDVFEHDSDLFPRGHSIKQDKKLIHPYGVVSRVRFEPVEEPVARGLLGTSCEGLIRISDGSVDSVDGFAPGVALKFPVTGRASADMVLGPAKFDPEATHASLTTVTQRTYLGVPEVNRKTRDLRTLVWLFDRYREKQLVEQGYEPMHFAGRAVSPLPLLRHHQDGTEAPDLVHGDPIALHYEPTEAFRDAWEEAGGKKKYWSRLTRMFSTGDAPLPLYEVHGIWHADEPTRHLGTLWLTEAFLRSKFGDLELFFRHPSDPPSPDLAALFLREARSAALEG